MHSLRGCVISTGAGGETEKSPDEREARLGLGQTPRSASLRAGYSTPLRSAQGDKERATASWGVHRTPLSRFVENGLVCSAHPT